MLEIKIENLQSFVRYPFLAFIGFTMVSISPTQFFLFLALISSYLLIRQERYTIPQSYTIESNRDAVVSMSSYCAIYLAYALWRLSQALHSSAPLTELFIARETGLFLVFPLTLFVLKRFGLSFQRQLLIVLVAYPVLASVYYLSSTWLISLRPVDARMAFAGWNPLTFGGCLAMIFFLSLGLLAQRAKLKERFKWHFLIVCIVIFLALVYNNSRGVLLALAFTVVLFGLFRFRSINILFIPLVILFSLWYLPKSNYFNAAILGQIKSIFEHTGTLAERYDMWKAGIQISQLYPILGTGAADYMSIYLENRTPGSVGTAATGSHMHNDYIDMLVLYGIPGYLFLCCFYFMPIIHFFKFQHIAKENHLFYVGLGGVMAIICLSFMSLSQCHFSDEEVQMLFWFAVGLIYHSITSPSQTIKNTS